MRETTVRLLLCAAVTVALGFGARQALASTGSGPGFGPGGVCYGPTCDYWCVTEAGANYGFCLNGTCVCRNGP
jgi:hypothetical protein